MMPSARRLALRVASITQALLAQHAIKLIGAEAAQVVHEVLRHEDLVWVARLDQHLLGHCRDGVFAQLWPVPQTIRASLKLWHTAVHQRRAQRLNSTDLSTLLPVPDIVYELRL